MRPTFAFALSVAVAVAVAGAVTHDAHACCPAPPSGKPVVNADQSVILLWDSATKTEHFIRRASFKSEADDFGFLVPTPAKPELDEAGDAAFPMLADVTKPDVIYEKHSSSSSGCGCMRGKSESATAAAPPPQVAVLEEKTVAGFHAVVLEATSATALVGWLKDHGYAFSPEVEAWAKPYVDGGWKITALQIAKKTPQAAGGPREPDVAASSLRISFKTDQPLFPYREPDTTKMAPALGVSDRLLRIYFVGDARYDGKLGTSPWTTGQTAWSNKLTAEQRSSLLGQLRLPGDTAPGQWWLTEFEDHWPYRVAPADLYFAKSAAQTTVKRPPIIRYTSRENSDTTFAYGILLVPLAFRFRRQRTVK